MFFSWRKTERRKKILAEPFPAAWSAYLAGNVRHYQYLEPSAQAALRNMVQVFVAEKHWAGGAGLSVTDEMKVTVAAQASLLVSGFPQPYYYDQVPSIIVYPRQYVRPRQVQENYFIVRDDWELCGEAWHRGPIVLSWEDVLAGGRDVRNGRNVVFHEFAHHLDFLNGELDGAPPLGARQRRNWNRTVEAEYDRLVGSAQRKEPTFLDHYGATNKTEFFAVATECFFEQPNAMNRFHKELYGILRDFYLQDPAQRFPDATIESHGWRIKADAAKDLRLDHVREAELDTLLIASKDTEKLFMLGVECFDHRQYRLAVRAFSQVIELDPTDAEAHQRRARARTHLGEYAEALSDAQEALRLDGDDTDSSLARGAACLGLGQYEHAREDFTRVIRGDRDNAEAYYLRGLAWTALGRLRRAVRDFSFAIALRPQNAEAYYRRAHAHRQLGYATKANADLEKALQLDPHVG